MSNGWTVGFFKDHPIRFVYKDGKRVSIPVDVAKASGYVPINEFLEFCEEITQTIPINTEYFALTSNGRVLFVSHWYGDSVNIQVPNVARDIYSILNHENKELAESFKKGVRSLILEKLFNRPIAFLMRNVNQQDEIWERLMEAVDFRKYVNDTIEEVTKEKKKGFNFVDDFSAHPAGEFDDYKEQRGVYFVKADNGLTKIGRTTNLLDRLSELQTASPCELTLEWFIETDSEKNLEKELHDVFAEKRVRGEWFLLSNDDLSWINNLDKKTDNKGQSLNNKK